MYYTVANSALYWKVLATYHEADRYIKMKLEIRYKSNNSLLEVKTGKISRYRYEAWEEYKMSYYEKHTIDKCRKLARLMDFENSLPF